MKLSLINRDDPRTSKLGLRDSFRKPGSRGSYAVNVVNDIKYKARKRGKAWELTNEQAYELITSPCTYCGFTPHWPDSRVGIDRRDNSFGYVEGNCVPCCFTCNSAKGSKTVDEFLDWLKQAYRHSIE